MLEAPRCPRCDTVVEPDWDWCKACGYGDDDGADDDDASAAPPPRSAVPKPPRVYEPDDEPGRRRIVSIALAIVATFTISVLAAQLLLFDRGDGSITSGPQLADLDGRGEQTLLDDGWFRLDSAGRPLTVEMPLSLWRTRDSIGLVDGTTVSATFYVHLDEHGSLVLIVAADLEADAGMLTADPERLLSQLRIAPLTGATLSPGIERPLDAGPAWYQRGSTAGGADLHLLATEFGSTLVVLAVADPDPDVAAATFTRMARTLDAR